MMWPILGSRTAKEQNRTGLASVEMSAHTSFAHAGQNDSDKRAKTRLPMTSQSSTAEQSAFHTQTAGYGTPSGGRRRRLQGTRRARRPGRGHLLIDSQSSLSDDVVGASRDRRFHGNAGAHNDAILIRRPRTQRPSRQAPPPLDATTPSRAAREPAGHCRRCPQRRHVRAFQFGQKKFRFDSIRFGSLISLPLVH